MKKIAIIKKKEVALGLLAIFFLIVGFFSYNPIIKDEQETVVSDVQNYPESELGEATLVSSNDVEDNDDKDDDDNEIEEEVDTLAKKDFFLEARMDRDNTYSQSVEVYEKILENTSISNDQKAIAQNEISNITNEKKVIATAENLIKFKGFEDVVIFKNENGVTVIVKAETLQPEQVAQIQNIIQREFQIDGSKIVINQK